MNTLISGSFVSSGVAFNLALESGYDEFHMVNITDVGSAAAATPVMRAYASSLMPAGSAYLNLKTNGAPSLQIESMITTLGFTFFDDSNPQTFPLIAVTAVTAASPAQVTAANHGLAVGDTVRLTGLNGTMGSMNGLDYTVDSIVGVNDFTITFDASAAGAGQVGNVPATAGFMRKIIPNPFAPRNVVIGPTKVANISTAGGLLQLNMNTVPSVSQGPSQYSPFLRPYQPGAIMRFYVPERPQAFNLPQTANFILAQVVQVIANPDGGYTVPNTLQLRILANGNPTGSITTATGLPALIYPAGGATYKSSFPYVTDVAEISTDLSEAEDNTGIRGITIGTGVQTTGKLYQWFARRGFSI